MNFIGSINYIKDDNILITLNKDSKNRLQNIKK